jgi:hypothetical protein
LNDKHTKQIHAANLMIKLLRDKLKNSPEDPMKLMDEKTTKILQELEGSMLERVEVNRWSASVGEMRREIAALKGAEDITPSMNDITVHVPNNPIGAESLKELMLNKYARDKSLGLDNGKQESANFSGTAIPWSEEAEVKFQTALQEKYTKVVEEKDVLAEQLESVMNDKANSEKPTNAPTSKFAAVMQDEFGGSSDIDVLDIKPQRTSVSKSRRSSVGRVGGRFSIGGSEVSHWSAVQESNKTIREAENKIDAVSKQLHEKSLELAEANKLNAVLAREKAELLAGGAISTPEGDSPALIEKIVSSETEIQALKDEIERIEQKRAEDQVAAEEAEAQLRELAQLEIDEAARQKLLAEKFQAEAAEEAKAASEAASEAALMRQAAEEAKEAEAVALSKVKALEDEMETLSEQMEYVNAGSEEKTMEIERLKNESNAQMQEIESNKRQLESQKADFLSLQAQIESSSKEGNSAVENLQQQLSAQMMKYAALQEDQVTAEQTLTTMTTALAKSETIATELRQQLLIAQENGNLANEAASDLKKEVWKLRDDIANVEATLNHTKVELESVKDDREEVNASLQDAERLAEELREQLDVEKDNYVETLNKQADTIAELEEALESEQQMIMEEDSKRKNDIANLEAKWRAEVDVISAKESAALARAEQAEAEVGVLRNDTQRDVQEAERELLTTKQALKSEEEKRSKLEKDMAVQTAKYEEQVCKVQELKLEVENSTNSYNTIFARTVEHDVQLAAAEREAEKMREIAESAELSKNELMEQLTLVEARVEELTLACVEAKEVATRAEAKAENSKIMEQEAYEKSLEFERTYDIMKADMDKANEKIKSLTEEFYSYTGHSNQNQKIHIMSKLRNENNELKNEIEDLRKLKVSPLPKVKPVLDDDLLASKLESEAAMRVADVMRAEDEAAAGTENSENAKPLLSPKKSSAAVPAVPPSPLTEKNLN